MKKIGLVLLVIICWTAPASAARVYLKDGSWINAQKVWRDTGKVVVLINRDLLTSFTDGEVNLKKTFPPRKKRVKAGIGAAAVVPPAAATMPFAAQPVAQPAKEGRKLSMPSLTTALPEREPPKGAEEGAIRRQKKEMEKRLNE